MPTFMFPKMAETLLIWEPKAVFEYQGNRIVNKDGAIVDEASGEPLICDKYTMMYTYKRVQ